MQQENKKTIYELKKNDKTKVLNVNGKGAIRERFVSFGIVRGADIEVKNCNVTRDNIEILVNGTFIALRKEEAKLVEVI